MFYWHMGGKWGGGKRWLFLSFVCSSCQSLCGSLVPKVTSFWQSIKEVRRPLQIALILLPDDCYRAEIGEWQICFGGEGPLSYLCYFHDVQCISDRKTCISLRWSEWTLGEDLPALISFQWEPGTDKILKLIDFLIVVQLIHSPTRTNISWATIFENC